MCAPSPSVHCALFVGLALFGTMLVSAIPGHAQSVGPLHLEAAAFGTASSADRLPFWLSANAYGTVDRSAGNLGTRLSVARPFRSDDRFDYAFGADLLARASEHGTVYIHQLYGRIRYRKLQLTVGRREQMIGRVDTSRSLGSTTWSRNATPPPKISLSSDGYLSVPGTSDFLALKGYFAHGWLEDDRFVNGALLHEKYVYLRLLPDDFPVTAHAGITHHVQWGGTHPRLGTQPTGFGDWLNVVLGQRSEGEDEPTDPVGQSNHIATYDFSLSADLGGVEALAYREFYHEDTPSLLFRNPWDGIWGLSLRRDDSSALVNALLWEHLRMTRHNAKFSEGQERGADRYYHHSRYAGGWVYEGRTLGTPMLTPNRTAPGVANTIVIAQHVALEGALSSHLSYRLFGTYSRNYGAQGICANADCTRRVDGRTPRRDQWSFLAEVTGSLSERHGLSYEAAVGVDTGAFYDERGGARLGVTWRGATSPR